MGYWIDDRGTVTADGEIFVDADGVTHTAQRDKSTIEDLTAITETDRPDETPDAYTADGSARGGVVVTGWHVETVDGIPVQVWDTEARTDMTEAEAEAAEATARASGWSMVRTKRAILLTETDALLLRHQDQEALVSAGGMAATTLTADQIAALRAYRQTLRDLPETFGAPDADPTAVEWPVNPLSD